MYSFMKKPTTTKSQVDRDKTFLKNFKGISLLPLNLTLLISNLLPKLFKFWSLLMYFVNYWNIFNFVYFTLNCIFKFGRLVKGIILNLENFFITNEVFRLCMKHTFIHRTQRRHVGACIPTKFFKNFESLLFSKVPSTKYFFLNCNLSY